MKKILMALALISASYYGADAKEKCSCPSTAKHMSAKHSKGGGAKYAENFKVCKDNYGYHICGENATCSNSTYCIPGVNKGPRNMDVAQNSDWSFDNDQITNRKEARDYAQQVETTPAMPAATAMAPQSQSYPTVTDYRVNVDNSYAANNIKVYYDDAQAPYHGEASPQDDGPTKNRVRNLNVNSVAQTSTDPGTRLAPIDGSGSGR